MAEPYVPTGTYAILLRIAGVLIALRGAVFFLSSLFLSYTYGQQGTISNYSTSLFWTFLFFAFTLAFGLKLAGVRFASNRSDFLEKQASLNPSTPGSLNYQKKRPTHLTTPERTFLRPTTMLICFLIDFFAAIALEKSLPALPRFYFVMVFEFIIFALTVLELNRIRY